MYLFFVYVENLCNCINCKLQEKEANDLTREIQTQERRSTALETTVRHMESDITKKRTELERKSSFIFFYDF